MILYLVFGYLCGSIMFARLFGVLMKGRDVTAGSADKNPGTANAFLYGGFWCGFLTLCGDLCKGFWPVWLYLRTMPPADCNAGLALLMAAPVLGHIWPIAYQIKRLSLYGKLLLGNPDGREMGFCPEEKTGQRLFRSWQEVQQSPLLAGFRGGKGIAVTFGSLLGLAPETGPVLILAMVFLFLSLVIRITPHYNRTMWTYRLAAVLMVFMVENRFIVWGFLIIMSAVNLNLHFSDEKREKCQVRLLWMH